MKFYFERVNMFVLIPTIIYDKTYPDICLVWLIWQAGVMKKGFFYKENKND